MWLPVRLRPHTGACGLPVVTSHRWTLERAVRTNNEMIVSSSFRDTRTDAYIVCLCSLCSYIHTFTKSYSHKPFFHTAISHSFIQQCIHSFIHTSESPFFHTLIHQCLHSCIYICVCLPSITYLDMHTNLLEVEEDSFVGGVRNDLPQRL